MGRSRRERRRAEAQRAGQPAAPPARPATATPLRLGPTLTRRETAAVVVVTAAGLAAFAGFVDRFDWFEAHAFVPVILTFLLLGAAFAVEQRALVARRATLRFAGVGILTPLLWWVVPFGAITPIAAMQGLTCHRLGLGSLTPPAFAGALATGVAFGPTAGMLAAAGHVWGGLAALLLTRDRG